MAITYRDSCQMFASKSATRDGGRVVYFRMIEMLTQLMSGIHIIRLLERGIRSRRNPAFNIRTDKADKKTYTRKNDHVLQWTLDACPTVLSSKTTDGLDECGKFVAWALEQQRVLPKNVPLIIVNRTSLYAFGPNESDDVLKRLLAPMYFESPDSHGLPEHLEKMRAGIINTACAFKADREVYLVRPIPEQRINVPKFTGRALLFGVERDISVSMEEYKKRNAFVWEAQDAAVAACGVKVLDPLPYLCDERACHGSNGGLPIYYDDDHLNLRGAALLAPMFSTVFKNKE